MVLVQHLAPQRDSALPTLLAARTSLPVVQAAEGMRVEPDVVYVIPPNAQMSIKGETLHLVTQPSDRTRYSPIDFFLHSLAESAQQSAIGIVLSGTGSDGTAGLREIKAVGGITIAQSPESAAYTGMPAAAVASGAVDLVLHPAAMGAELAAIVRHRLSELATVEQEALPSSKVKRASTEQHIEQIFRLLRAASGVDFRQYKRPTIDRRLQRRMLLHKLSGLDQYVQLLREQPAEVQALYDDILIRVTRFFRNPEVYAAFTDCIAPRLTHSPHTEEQPIRAWIPGCSTGEEAYSLAITILEGLSKAGRGASVQLFATDISNFAIERAREGRYPYSIAADVSLERLRRFFSTIDGGGYRINKAVRNLCVFARHDVTRDPPFSQLDVIFCRNLLIYLSLDLQRRLMSVFHYALKPAGLLVLGNAETIGSSGDLFATVDRKHRIYAKNPGVAAAVPSHVQHGRRAHPARAPARHPDASAKVVEREAARLLQERYAPPGVIVDDDFHVIQFRGQTGAFLEPPPGEPSMNLLKMAREGLLHPLREAIAEVRKDRMTVHKRKLRVRADGGWRVVNIHVTPLVSAERLHFLVLFEEPTSKAAARRMQRESLAARQLLDDQRSRPASQLSALRKDLVTTREHLQAMIQDLEAANEELQSANEEILSSNEEMQSTNEELDTAKEELQSTNEELNTVNEELHIRNEELSRVNSDLMNLLSSVHIAIVIVDADLRIRRFTPMAERALNLIDADIGRPIGHINPNIDCPNLEQLITQVIETLTPCETEVRDQNGQTLALRIRPYKNLENRIDGAVLALFPQSTEHSHTGSARALAYAKAVIETVRHPVVLLGQGWRVQHANRAFTDAFGMSPLVVGGSFFDLADGMWNIPRLRSVLYTELQKQPSISGVEITHDFPRLGKRHMLVDARWIAVDGDTQQSIVLSFQDLGAGPDCDRP